MKKKVFLEKVSKGLSTALNVYCFIDNLFTVADLYTVNPYRHPDYMSEYLEMIDTYLYNDEGEEKATINEVEDEVCVEVPVEEVSESAVNKEDEDEAVNEKEEEEGTSENKEEVKEGTYEDEDESDEKTDGEVPVEEVKEDEKSRKYKGGEYLATVMNKKITGKLNKFISKSSKNEEEVKSDALSNDEVLKKADS